MKEFVGLRAKTYSYLKDSNYDDEKAKGTKKCAIKIKLKFEDYKNCLELDQAENKMNHLEENKVDADSLKEDRKEFIKNNKLILKTKQRFRSGKHNVFTEEINKVALSSNYDKIIQPIHYIEISANRTSKDLICKKKN